MSGEALRVLHLLAPAPYGGLESVVRQLARALGDAGVGVHVAAVLEPDSGPHPFVERARNEGIAVHVLEARGRAYGQERAAVRQLLDETDAHVLHTHGYRPDVIDAPVARRSGVATVSTAHGFVGNSARGRFYEWMQRRAYRRFDAVIAVSGQIERRIVRSGVPAARVHRIPNAWTPPYPPADRNAARRALDLPEDGHPIVGWVGRIGVEKGPDVFLRALADEALAGVQGCLVGEGDAAEAARALAVELGISDRVTWAGAVLDAGRYMRAFDVLCLSSRTEGTPMVLFEADAADLPVVATAVGGVGDVLGAGWNIVQAEDAPALAGALARAVSSAEAADEARERARRRIAAEYDPDRWLERHIALYTALRKPSDGVTGRLMEGTP